MKYAITAHPKGDWAPLPLGEYPSVQAALAAIADCADCYYDDYGNDPTLYITPIGDKPHIPGYDEVCGWRVDVSDWPNVKLRGKK